MARLERRRLLAGVLALAAPAALGACVAPAPALGPGPGEFVIVNQGDIFSLDLWTASAAHAESIWAMQQLYEPLVRPARDGGFEGAVAESWTTSADGLVTTFELRPGLAFSDGSPVTAQDVVYSLAMGSDSEVFGFLNQAITDVVATGPATVEVHTASVWAPLLADLSIFSNSILPKDLGGVPRDAFFRTPVGTGPFVVESWDVGSELRLAPNPHYRIAGEPELASVSIRTVPDDNTRALMLRGGQAHLMGSPAYATLAPLAASPGVAIDVSNAEKVFYLLMNQTDPPFADPLVRSAVAHALDRDAMVAALLFGHGRVADSFLPPSAPFYDNSAPTPGHDPARARADLAASGFPRGFTTRFVVGGTDQFGVTLAELVQQDLASIGITVEISRIDPGAVSQARQHFEYGLQADWFLMDIADPDEILSYVLDAENGGAHAYYTRYSSPQMSTLLSAAARASEPGRRAELYRRAQALAARDLPQVPLFYAPTVWGLAKQVRGFAMLPTGSYRLGEVSLGS